MLPLPLLSPSPDAGRRRRIGGVLGNWGTREGRRAGQTEMAEEGRKGGRKEGFRIRSSFAQTEFNPILSRVAVCTVFVQPCCNVASLNLNLI